jgi:hypothetical protein
MSAVNPTCFVWMYRLGRYEPQIWHEGWAGVLMTAGMKLIELPEFQKTLTDKELSMGLDYLIKLYPAPKPPTEEAKP